MARTELHQAVDALRAGRFAEAVEQLRAAGVQPPELEARRQGLLAQAELGLDRPDAAKEHLRTAMRLARALGDEAGVTELRSLNGRIYARLAEDQEQERRRHEEAAEMQRPLAELLVAAEDDAERAMVYVRKANAAIGTDSEADALAAEGLRLADASGAPRPRVLARLCLARIDEGRREALLREAHAVADTAEEAQLLAAVVQAARSVGLDLVSFHF